jgi:hypothetical protein
VFNENRVSVEYKGPRFMAGLVKACQWNFFDRVTRMELKGFALDDRSMPSLEGLQFLESLTFKSTRVSNQWVQRFRKLHPECVVTKDDEFKSDLQAVNTAAVFLIR